MELTKQQVLQMQGQGLDLGTIQSLAAKNGYTMPKERDFLEKAENIVTKLFPGQKVGQAIGEVGGLVYTQAKEKLGFVPEGTSVEYYKSMGQGSPTPLQVGGDIVRGAATVAGAKLPVAGSILGKMGQFGALGGISAGASGIAEGKSLAESAGQAVRGAGIGALTGLTFGLLEKGVRGLTSGVGKVGTKIQQGVIRPTDADFKDGFKMTTLQKYNLGGSLQDTMNKTDAQLDDLAQQLNNKLAASNTSINMNRVYENTTKRLFGDRLAGFGSNTQLSGAAQKLQEEILYSAGPNGLVSVPEAQIIKRAAGHYGAWQYGFQDPQAKASERVYNLFYNELKNEIERSSPTGVQEINKKMGELIPIMNAVIRRIPIAERNRGLSLTDIITLVGATVDTRALAVTGINAAQKSGRVGNFLSKAPALGQSISRGISNVEQAVQTAFPSTR